jgi:hypothetical protein
LEQKAPAARIKKSPKAAGAKAKRFLKAANRHSNRIWLKSSTPATISHGSGYSFAKEDVKLFFFFLQK